MRRIWEREVPLALGAIALCFSNGATANVAAAWIAPALLLIFVMNVGPWIGFATTALVSAAASFMMFRGVIPISDAEYAVASFITGAIGAIPFFLHRLIAPRLGALIGSLVFPSACVTLGFVLAQGNPFGTWGHDAYVQLLFAPLAQFGAVAGLWGIGFFVYWFASVVQGLVTSRELSAKIAAGLFAASFLCAIGYGALRLNTPAPTQSVRIAAINNPATLPDRFFVGCAERTDYTCRSASATARLDALFALSQQAVRDGAKIVVWYESAAQYDAPDEPQIIARASAFARAHDIYLVIGVVRVPLEQDALMTNAAMVFTPQGERAFEYLKSIPVPGEPIVRGDGVIPTLDTPYGRLGVMICFDADFPALSRQAASQGVDIMLVPANDWRAITPLHADMTRMRAIENGFSVVRATSNGRSLISDPYGRVLAAADSFTSPSAITVADVPAQRIATAYGALDDMLAAVCMVLTLLFALAAVALAIWSRLRRSKAAPVS